MQILRALPGTILTTVILSRPLLTLASIDYSTHHPELSYSSSTGLTDISDPLSFAAINSTAPRMPRAPVIAFSHGGGPMPLLGDNNHAAVVRSLQQRVPKVLKLDTPDAPRALVVVTAHWSTDKHMVSSGAKHPLYYDYYNFPKEAYEIKYDAPGSPEVAAEVYAALTAEGLDAELDAERGWDHGIFVPMKIMRPQADVPIVQVSVLKSEDPAAHVKMGRALATLRDKNVAIVGSGFASFHNLKTFRHVMGDPSFRKKNDDWGTALTEAVRMPDVEERGHALEHWREFPHSYDMHPRHQADHFMPLLVCAGAGGEGVARMYTDEWLGLDMYSYYWD